ncbi:ATP-dependent DNA helicase sgs1 [Mortierella claussenii]|nr:ATP-dependent DNA helicase sgs1 [Mortierella claussenii]
METPISSTLLKQLAEGSYRTVFLSPELIFSDERISRLWAMSGWRKRLYAVVVDEAHCICTWGGDFRKDYSRIGELCCLVLRMTPFLTLSATLPSGTLDAVRKSLHCQPDIRIINIGNDRPNTKNIVSILQQSIGSL